MTVFLHLFLSSFEEDDDDDDSDSDSEIDDSSNNNGSFNGGTTPSDSPRAKRESGTHTALSPPTDLSANSGSNNGSSRGTGSNRSLTEAPKKATVRKELPPGAPNRPTYRTNKKMTKRDIKVKFIDFALVFFFEIISLYFGYDRLMRRIWFLNNK
jgi:hypothetical protein